MLLNKYKRVIEIISNTRCCLKVSFEQKLFKKSVTL